MAPTLLKILMEILFQVVFPIKKKLNFIEKRKGWIVDFKQS